MLGACALQREAATVRGLRTTMKSGPCSPQLEKAHTQKRRPSTAKIKRKKEKETNKAETLGLGETGQQHVGAALSSYKECRGPPNSTGLYLGQQPRGPQTDSRLEAPRQELWRNTVFQHLSPSSTGECTRAGKGCLHTRL